MTGPDKKTSSLTSCKPVFIVGCPRSGTHLLRNLLRSHPNLSLTGETHFIPRFYRAFGDPENSRQAVKLASLVLDLEWIRPWQLPLKPESFAGERSYVRLVRRIFESWAQKENKNRWGDKTPQYIMEMPLLSKLFPGCKFIHIIRDGRDVALSWLDFPYGPVNIYTAAIHWRKYVGTGRLLAKTLPADCYMEVRFEKLLEQPGTVMPQICSFLDEPFYREVLTPDPLKLDYVPFVPVLGRFRSFFKNNRSETIVKKSSGWRENMSVANRTVFESVAGDLLHTLGYETTGKLEKISILRRRGWHMQQSLMWSLNYFNNRNRGKWIKTDFILRWTDWLNKDYDWRL